LSKFEYRLYLSFDLLITKVHGVAHSELDVFEELVRHFRIGVHMRDAYVYSARELQRVHVPAFVPEIFPESIDVEIVGTYRDNRRGWFAEYEDFLYLAQAVAKMITLSIHRTR